MLFSIDMDNVLDKEQNLNDRKNSSWKPILVTNGILAILFAIYAYYSSIDFRYLSFTPSMIIGRMIVIFCCGIILINIFFTFLSLIFFRKYWKKWIVMVGFGILLFITISFIQSFIDISNLIL